MAEATTLLLSNTELDIVLSKYYCLNDLSKAKLSLTGFLLLSL